MENWLDETLLALQKVFSYEIFALGETKVTLTVALTFVFLLAMGFIASRLAKNAIDRVMRRRPEQVRVIPVIQRLAHYAIMLVAVGIALDSVGINLNSLMAAGAVLAVAIGFAVQSITQNFVSGLILLLERAIKPGDILLLEGDVVKVKEMNIRATLVTTPAGEEMIVPNNLLSNGKVVNYTLHDSWLRITCLVGVAYESNMHKVLETLHGVATAFGATHGDPPAAYKPSVHLRGFGASSVDFAIQVWIEDPWRAPQAKSDLNVMIWDALEAHDITIAFPQLDVHLNPELRPAVKDEAVQDRSHQRDTDTSD